jgi:hypothetical protein
MSNDRSYFMRRAAQERSAAANAAGDEARDVHSELAKRYRKLVKNSPANSPEEPLVSP